MEWGGDPDCWAFLPGPEKDDSDEVRLRAQKHSPAAPSEAGLHRVGVSSGLARPPPGAAGGLCSCGRPASLHGRACPPLATPHLLCPRHPHGAQRQGQQGTCLCSVQTQGRGDCETPEEGSRKAAAAPRCPHHTLPQPPRSRCRPLITNTKCVGRNVPAADWLPLPRWKALSAAAVL